MVHISTNYRQIWQKYYGDIPLDDEGRSYEIHHVDGDHTNNNITNLRLVSAYEHFYLHYIRGDWRACQLIAFRIKQYQTHDFLGDLARKLSFERLANGTHNFLTLEHRQQNSRIQREIQIEKVENGTHLWLGPETNLAKVANGTHPFVGGAVQRRRVADRTHNWLGSEHILKRIADGTDPWSKPGFRQWLGKHNSKIQLQKVEDGTHRFVVDNPAKKRICCLECKEEMGVPMFKRWHSGANNIHLIPTPFIGRICCVKNKKEMSLLMFERWHGSTEE